MDQIYVPDEKTRKEFRDKVSLHTDWLHLKFLELCQNGHLEFVNYVFSEFPTYTFQYSGGLEKACESGNIQLIQMLFEKAKTHYLEFGVELSDTLEYLLKNAIRITSQHNHFHVLEHFIKTNGHSCRFHNCTKEGIRHLLNRGYYYSISNSPYRQILNKERRRRIHRVTQILKDEIWTLQNFPLMDLNIIRFILVPYIAY